MSLNLEKIKMLGYAISEHSNKEDYNKMTINIEVSENEFPKIEEDIFYRSKQEGEFVPSDDEIHINFEDFTMCIKKSNYKQVDINI